MFNKLKSLGLISLLLVLSLLNTSVYAEEQVNKKVPVQITLEEVDEVPTGNNIQAIAGDKMDVDVSVFIRVYQDAVLKVKFYYQKLDNCVINPPVNPEPQPENPPVNPEPKETLPITGSDSSNTTKAIILLAASSVLLFKANKKQKIYVLILMLGVAMFALPSSITAEEASETVEVEVIDGIISIPVPKAPECTKIVAGEAFIPNTGGDTSTNTADK